MNRYSIVLVAAAVAAVLPVHAQTAASPSAELKQAYAAIKGNLTKMSDKATDELYGFKATPEIRTFGQLVGHVADSQARTCSAVAGGDAKTVGGGTKTTKADLAAAMKESFAICDPVFEGLTDANANEAIKTPRGSRSRIGALVGLVVHSNEEYGYMAVYMRLKGIVPPSSEPR